MAFFAMRHVDSLATPAVLKWGTQDFEATDPEFNAAIHDQVPLRTDVSEVPGVPTRYHRAVIVPPDVTLHTLEEMNQTEKDDVDAVLGIQFRSLFSFADGRVQIDVGDQDPVIITSVCFLPSRLLGDPSIARVLVALAYNSDTTLECEVIAEHAAGPTVVLPQTILSASGGVFVRAEIAPSRFIPTDDELIEFIVRAQKTAGGAPAQIRSVTLSFIEDTGGGGG